MPFKMDLTDFLFFQMLVQVCISFNVTEVEELNESISKHMLIITNKQKASKMQREITFYTGGMCGIVLNILDPFYEGDITKICKDIYEYGKPKFINLTIDEDKYRNILFWGEEEFEFFNDLRTDANTIWCEFVNTYKKHKMKNSTVLL